MKVLLFVSVLMLAGFANAESITCGFNERYSDESQPRALTMTLTSLGKSVNDVYEGTSVPYSLVLKNGDQVWLNVKVKAAQEDVLFAFKHRSREFGNITGHIYMDELDQTSVYVNGTKFSFDCNEQ